MKTVELLRTVLFLPTWIGTAWLVHAHAGWGWAGSAGLGLVAAIVICLVATLIHDRLS